MGGTRHQHIQGWRFYFHIAMTSTRLNFSLSPILFQSRTLPASMRISRVCCRQSPSAIRTPPPKVLVKIRYRPWNNSRQGSRIRARSTLLACGIMTFGLQSTRCHPWEKNSYISLCGRDFLQNIVYEKTISLLFHCHMAFRVSSLKNTAYIYSTWRLTLHQLSNES